MNRFIEALTQKKSHIFKSNTLQSDQTEFKKKSKANNINKMELHNLNVYLMIVCVSVRCVWPQVSVRCVWPEVSVLWCHLSWQTPFLFVQSLKPDEAAAYQQEVSSWLADTTLFPSFIDGPPELAISLSSGLLLPASCLEEWSLSRCFWASPVSSFPSDRVPVLSCDVMCVLPQAVTWSLVGHPLQFLICGSGSGSLRISCSFL